MNRAMLSASLHASDTRSYVAAAPQRIENGLWRPAMSVPADWHGRLWSRPDAWSRVANGTISAAFASDPCGVHVTEYRSHFDGIKMVQVMLDGINTRDVH